MRCDEVSSLLADALTRPLSTGEAQALEAHGESCEACAEAWRHLDADREVLRRFAADSARLQGRSDFDAVVTARVVATRSRAVARPSRLRFVRARWAVPALAVAAALAALLVTRPLDDARTPAPLDLRREALSLYDEGQAFAEDDTDALGMTENAETMASDADAESGFAVFSRDELAFLDARVDDILDDEISEMSDDAARGLESEIDAARKTKSG